MDSDKISNDFSTQIFFDRWIDCLDDIGLIGFWENSRSMDI